MNYIELRGCGILNAGPCHCKHVADVKKIIFKAVGGELALDRGALLCLKGVALAVLALDNDTSAALDHEVFDNSVEYCAVKEFIFGELFEVSNGNGCYVTAEYCYYRAVVLDLDKHVVALLVRGLEVLDLHRVYLALDEHCANVCALAGQGVVVVVVCLIGGSYLVGHLACGLVTGCNEKAECAERKQDCRDLCKSFHLCFLTFCFSYMILYHLGLFLSRNF